MRNKVIAAVASLGVMVLALPGAAGAADKPTTFAPPDDCYHPVTSPDGGALVCFRPYGEHLYVCDNAADGHHPAARFTRSDQSGTSVEHSYLPSPRCTDVNLEIPDNGWINYQACNYEGDTELGCGGSSGKVSAHNDPARYEPYYAMFLRGERRIPYLDTTDYVPQGLAHWPARDAMVVSYYDDAGGPARLAIVDRETSTHLKSLYVDNDGHAQALTTSSTYLWLASTTDGTNREIIRYRWSDIAAAAPGSTIERADDFALKAKSFLEIENDSRLYVGSFHSGTTGTAHRYTLDDDENPHDDGHSFTVPSKVQGMAITPDHFVWSRSYGRDNDSTLDVDPRSGPIVRTVTAPNMSEDLATVDGRIYVVYESAAKKYADSSYKVRTIQHGTLSALIP